jgi:hypothetical protein
MLENPPRYPGTIRYFLLYCATVHGFRFWTRLKSVVESTAEPCCPQHG